MFVVNSRNNQFLFVSVVLDGEELVQNHSSNFNSNTNTDSNTNTNKNTDYNLKSILNYNYKGTPLLCSTILPGANELSEIAKLKKEETNDKLTETDKNTMNCKMEIKQEELSFDVENSIAPLLGF